jgi:CBS domain-containing protein
MTATFKVIDAMTTRPISVKPGTTLVECAKIMKDKNVGSVLVLEGKVLHGIVTEWDFVRKAIADELDIQKSTVDNIMCRSVQTIEPNVNLFDAIVIMTEMDIRHLPVVENGEFIGFLTSKDILKIEPALFDIIVEDFELREEERKPIFGEPSKPREQVLEDDEEL